MIAAIVLFVMSMILFWADYFFVEYTWMNFNDTAFRIAEIFLGIFIVLIVITGIIIITNTVKKVKNKKLFMISFTIILIFIVSFNSVNTYIILNSFEENCVSTNIYQKESGNGKYFITLMKEADTQEMIKIECDKNTYDNIIIDEDAGYVIKYRYNALDKSAKGSLYSNAVDNNVNLNNKKAEFKLRFFMLIKSLHQLGFRRFLLTHQQDKHKGDLQRCQKLMCRQGSAFHLK